MTATRAHPVVVGLGLGMAFWCVWWLLRLAAMQASGAGLHVDEAQYWWWSTDMAWGYYSKPPMIAALIHASTTLFGDGVVGVRALGMACWVATSALWWRWGVAVGLPRAGWLAALLLAASPLSGVLGLVVTTDGPLVLWWSAMMWTTGSAFTHGSESKGYWRQWVLTGLWFGLALLSKYTALIAGASWLLLWWAVPAGERRRWFGGMCLATAIGLLMLSPNLAWNALNDWPTLEHTLDITVRAAADPSTHLSVAQRLASAGGFVLGQGVLAGPAFVALAVMAWWRRGAANALPTGGVWTARGLAMWVVAYALPLLAVGTLQAWSAKAQVNWAAPAVVAACVGLGYVVARVGLSARAVSASVLSGVVLSAVLALGGDLRTWFTTAPLSERNQWDVWARMRGWPEVLAALKPAAAPYGSLPVVADGRTVLTEVAYEWRDQPKPWAWNDRGLVENHFDWFRHLDPQAHPSVLFVGQAVPANLLAVYPVVQPLQEARSGRVRLGLWLLQRTP